jgi:hypothetical protein
MAGTLARGAVGVPGDELGAFRSARNRPTVHWFGRWSPSLSPPAGPAVEILPSASTAIASQYENGNSPAPVCVLVEPSVPKPASRSPSALKRLTKARELPAASVA